MCDELIHPGLVDDLRVSRRAFGMLLGAAIGSSRAAAQIVGGKVAETDVVISTPDGRCDAVLFHPDRKDRWPAVLIWPDIMGLRPAFRDMGRQLASEGYTVLVPNPFYRSKHAPVIAGKIDFGDPAQRQILIGFRQIMTDDCIVRDAQAYLAFLDAQPRTNTAHKAGVQGYCMGGEFSFRTAAALPDRIGAVASFHGGNGLVTDKPDSPHLLISRTDATFLVCQAQNDDAQKPATKDVLKAAFAAAHRPATVEVYPANHGWCVPGSQVYDETQAQRAGVALTTLYRSTLA